jgi:hypothetical protein
MATVLHITYLFQQSDEFGYIRVLVNVHRSGSEGVLIGSAGRTFVLYSSEVPSKHSTSVFPPGALVCGSLECIVADMRELKMSVLEMWRVSRW